MNSNFFEKSYLWSYELILRLRDFFVFIARKSEDYKYLCVVERRCFNLAEHFLPQSCRKTLLTNSGLLRYHQKLALSYARTGQFPRILIVDDLLVHGRGLAKFLYQLEQLIEADLDAISEENGIEAPVGGLLYDKSRFRQCLLQAIDIYVYAQSSVNLLLEERYLNKVGRQMRLPAREMHDLSMQLSDSLARWEVCNTSFVYSQENLPLYTLCGSPGSERWKTSRWRRIDWNYRGEDMVLFIRLYGAPEVKRISTIRTFPNRYPSKVSPMFTSFSMAGNLDGEFLTERLECLADLLITSGTAQYRSLCELLTDQAPIIQRNKAQLLYFLLSILDYRSFCAELGIPWFDVQASDLDKVCCNFGLHGDVYHELCELLSSDALLDEIEDLLCGTIEKQADPLGCAFTEQPRALVGCEEANRAAEEIFYRIGIQSEESAKAYSEDMRWFHPSNYQNYERRDVTGKTDGIISIEDYYEIATSRLNEPSLFCPYVCTAALVAIMDNGILGVRIHYSSAEDIQVALAKAGELATFFGPRQVAVAIPAFALLEWHYRRIAETAQEAIKSFCAQRTMEEVDRLFTEEERAGAERDTLRAIEQMPRLAEAYTPIIYQGNQCYGDWNFENITYRPDNVWLKYQWYLQKKAEQFLGLSE